MEPDNRILEITPAGILDKLMTYDEYLSDARVKAQREERSAVAVVRSGGVTYADERLRCLFRDKLSKSRAQLLLARLFSGKNVFAKSRSLFVK